MATYGVAKLSASTDGKPIAVAATASGSATDLHTAVSGTTNYDIVELMASNADVDGEGRILNLSIGDTSVPHTYFIPANVGPVYLGRFIVQNGAVVEAWADEASDVKVTGMVMTVR